VDPRATGWTCLPNTHSLPPFFSLFLWNPGPSPTVLSGTPGFWHFFPFALNSLFFPLAHLPLFFEMNFFLNSASFQFVPSFFPTLACPGEYSTCPSPPSCVYPGISLSFWPFLFRPVANVRRQSFGFSLLGWAPFSSSQIPWRLPLYFFRTRFLVHPFFNSLLFFS